jgi:hypothetical protein
MAGIAAGCILALTLGCGGEPESHAPATVVPASTTSTSVRLVSTTVATSSSTTTPLPAPANADEARRLLERQGVDPAELSREIGEHMRHRFEPAPAE